MSGLMVVPIGRNEARRMCENHPHAQTLPNTSRYYLKAYIDGKPAGLAVWGWGITPRFTPAHLFNDGVSKLDDYLELGRFFVYDWCPKNTASQFLSFTHRIIKKYAPWVKWLYTYAAGFQGMIGGIYQAANYEYIGQKFCDRFTYIPDIGLVHAVALWHRFGSGHGKTDLEIIKQFYPNAKKWCGYNFRYIYWLCSSKEKEKLMQCANFVSQPYPTEDDLNIWLEDTDGVKVPITKEFAKSVPIVKFPSTRGKSRGSGEIDSAAQSNVQTGGASPTDPLLSLQRLADMGLEPKLVE